MYPAIPAVEFDADLLQKYNRPLPRYTSYPPVTEFVEPFPEIDLRAAIVTGNYKQTPLSLYCHIPFCETACYFCGCNTVITQHKAAAEPYLDALIRNIEQVAALSDSRRPVQQLHWGGGTPNYLSCAQIERLWAALTEHFTLSPQAEVSIEVNPAYLQQDQVNLLRQLGFNRISFGIQDFDPRVQAAVNRVQPEALIFEVMGWIREAGFESVNVDLIYGLPYQTLASFQETLHKTRALDPDRIAVFNFAFVPWLKPIQQRHIDPATLPTPAEKLDIFHRAIDELTAGGYQFIGMDHFAKPTDELAIAQRQGQLHRNFQGYTTQPESDLLAFGMTAISMTHDVYGQNHKSLRNFCRAVEQDSLPLAKGLTLDRDDVIRRAVIMELMCQFRLDKTELEAKYHLNFDTNFDEYFVEEQAELQALQADGLVRLSPNHIEVTPVGRLLVRNIASVFDTYLHRRRSRQFSQSV